MDISYDELDYQNLLACARATRPSTSRNGKTRQLSFASLEFAMSDENSMIDGNLQKILPLLTLKRVPWRTVLTELVWFLRGEDTIQYLTDHNVHIWDGNTTREFLDSRGLNDYPPGKAGPVYGVQWKKQLPHIIDQLRADPYSRRHIVNSWQICDLDAMALPPCHYTFQFVVRDEVSDEVSDENTQPPRKFLDVVVNMRSADLPLGVPFNIASYSLLTHIIAAAVGMTAGVLYLAMTNCHIYEEHMEAVNTMIAREPRHFPTMRFTDNFSADLAVPMTGDELCARLSTMTSADILVEGYDPHPTVAMKMVV